MCLSGYTMIIQVILELYKLPFTTAQIHLELPFCLELYTKKPGCNVA